MAVASASVEPPVSGKPAAAVPTSLFEAEQDRQAASDADEKPVREKVPAFLIQKPPVAEPNSPQGPKSGLDRFAGGIPMDAAAAPATAPDKPKSPFISTTPSEPEAQKLPRIKTAAPLATQDAIVPQRRFAEPAVARVPTFSSYAQQPSASSGAGTKIIWTIIILLVLGPAGYFGWRKLQPLRYIHRAPAVNTETTPVPSQPAAADASPLNVTPAPAADTMTNSGAPIIANGAPEGFPTKETIEVNPSADTPEPALTVVSKPEPLQVKRQPVEPVQAQPTPPSVVLPESKATDSTLAGLVPTSVAVPKPAPSALQVSEGVTQGLLIKKIAPVYPATALKLRKQGAVELLATVSKTGTITKIQVLRGESILAQAAVDAVRQWKYRPFLLNTEPVEIETEITINFKLPN
jgi:protein TonB